MRQQPAPQISHCWPHVLKHMIPVTGTLDAHLRSYHRSRPLLCSLLMQAQDKAHQSSLLQLFASPLFGGLLAHSPPLMAHRCDTLRTLQPLVDGAPVCRVHDLRGCSGGWAEARTQIPGARCSGTAFLTQHLCCRYCSLAIIQAAAVLYYDACLGHVSAAIVACNSADAACAGPHMCVCAQPPASLAGHAHVHVRTCVCLCACAHEFRWCTGHQECLDLCCASAAVKLSFTNTTARCWLTNPVTQVL